MTTHDNLRNSRPARRLTLLLAAALLTASCDLIPDETPDLFPEARVGDAPAERPEEAVGLLTPRRAANPDRNSIMWITGESLAAFQAPIPILPDDGVSINRLAVDLPVAEGETTTTLPRPIDEGDMSLTGTVVTPDGDAIPGATVRLERIVGEIVQPAEVRTNEAGQFTAANLVGGRYRIRAFRVPDMAMTEQAAFFLESDVEHQIELPISPLGGLRATIVSAPAATRVGDRANFWLRVSRSSVAADGTITSSSQPGVEVLLPSDARWTYPRATTTDEDGNTVQSATVTDVNGDVLWAPTCRQAGQSSATLRVRQPGTPVAREPGDTRPVVPAAPVFVSTTFTPPQCYAAIPSPSFNIGRRFTVPRDGQTPGGVYRGRPAKTGDTCAVSYEPFGTFGWSGETRTVTGNSDFLLEYPGRNFRAVAVRQSGDTPPASTVDEEGNVTAPSAPARAAQCTYERVG